MKWYCVLLIVLGMGSQLEAFQAGDSDRDGIDDATEASVLEYFAPVWKAHTFEPDEIIPPLPLDWYVEHSRLVAYDQDYNGRSLRRGGELLFDSGGLPITLEYLAGFDYDVPGFNWRLNLIDEFRRGDDPADPMTWDRLQIEQRGVYGRVAPAREPICGNHYIVQYYMFFGYNETDIPSLGGCNDFGEHEGDIIGVEFEVYAPPGNDWRIRRAIYSNHGRMIYIDNPGALVYEGGRPVVFLERGSQEPVPWAGTCGFDAGQPIPRCVSTNKIFEERDILGFWTGGGECSQWQVVRRHLGLGPSLLVTQVENLGEIGAPYPTPVSLFIQRFPGRFGDYAEDRICFSRLFGCECSGMVEEITSPKGPTRGVGELWSGVKAEEPRVWGSDCRDQAVVYVDRSVPDGGDGTAAFPVNHVADGLALVARGGQLILLGGSYPENLLLCEPVSITSSSPATIGR